MTKPKKQVPLQFSPHLLALADFGFRLWAGLIKITFDTITLFDANGKQTGIQRIERSDYTSGPNKGGQRVVLKRKEIFLQEGFSIILGNKDVKVMLQHKQWATSESDSSFLPLV
jgi:hypothetical protein